MEYTKNTDSHDNDDNEPIPVALHDASEPTQTYSASLKHI